MSNISSLLLYVIGAMIGGPLVLLFLSLPGIIAARRNHRNTAAIWVCGIFLWPVGLIWSLTDNTHQTSTSARA